MIADAYSEYTLIVGGTLRCLVSMLIAKGNWYVHVEPNFNY